MEAGVVVRGKQAQRRGVDEAVLAATQRWLHTVVMTEQAEVEAVEMVAVGRLVAVMVMAPPP